MISMFHSGTRTDVLVNLEAPVLVPHAAATGTSAGHKGETRYSYEVIFRSQHYALADNACREYLFLSEFFRVEPAQALDLFQEVMGKTTQLYIVGFNTSRYCFASYNITTTNLSTF